MATKTLFVIVEDLDGRLYRGGSPVNRCELGVVGLPFARLPAVICQVAVNHRRDALPGWPGRYVWGAGCLPGQQPLRRVRRSGTADQCNDQPVAVYLHHGLFSGNPGNLSYALTILLTA